MIRQGSENSGKFSQSGNVIRDIELQRLLIVHWDGQLRESLARAAGKLGFEVTSCSTISEARSLIEGTSFQGLIVDLEPYGDGVGEFLGWLSALGDKRPYTIVTMPNEAPSRVTELLGIGVDDVLSHDPETFDVDARLLVMESNIRRSLTEKAIIEKLKRNRSRYENLFLESPEAILVLKNRQGKVIGVNRAVKSVLGYDGKSLLGKYMSLIFPEIFGRNGHASSGEVLSGATVLKAIPYRRPDGKMIYLDIMMSAVPWDSGYAVMMLCRDVSDREGEEGNRMKDSKEEALSCFAAGVTGEFGDLLTSLGGNLSLLESAPFLNEESRNTVKRAQQACERGREILSEIASLNGARRVPLKNKIELPKLIEKATHFALFDFDGVRPLFRFSENLWCVLGDDDQIRRMLGAVVKNAAEVLTDACVEDGELSIEALNVEIGLESELPLRSGSYVHLTFRDNGPGLTDPELGRVFDPYFSRNKRGRGFGLSRAAAISRSHGGHMLVSSQLGEGACFEVYLPAQNGSENITKTESLSQSGLRVLVLDDEPHICAIVEKALTREGHEVFCAATGKAALRAFEKAEDFGRSFDVLLFDLDIRGGIGGSETLARIRATNPRVKAIVTTGYVDDTVLENYLEHGFCGVLTKPFRIEHLTSTVERLGRKHVGQVKS